MVFAQILTGKVLNTIVLNDIKLLSNYMSNPINNIPYDYVLQVDTLYPQPGIGWTYDGIRFGSPGDSDSGQDNSNSILEEESVTSVTTIAAPLNTDALMTNMSLNPGAGNYIVLFNCDISSSIAGAAISISLYVSNVQISGTLRKVIPYTGGALSSPPGRESVFINQTLSINNGDTIEVWWSTSNTGPSAMSRNLTLLKIA